MVFAFFFRYQCLCRLPFESNISFKKNSRPYIKPQTSSLALNKSYYKFIVVVFNLVSNFTTKVTVDIMIYKIKCFWGFFILYFRKIYVPLIITCCEWCDSNIAYFIKYLLNAYLSLVTPIIKTSPLWFIILLCRVLALNFKTMTVSMGWRNTSFYLSSHQCLSSFFNFVAL